MSERDLAIVVLMIFAVMIVMSFWRQIAIFVLSLIVVVFCFGVYCIVRLVGGII
jgi:hypothetical protein